MLFDIHPFMTKRCMKEDNEIIDKQTNDDAVIHEVFVDGVGVVDV
jgi:hypothetical protein